LGGAVLADVTATVRINSRFDLQAGVRNAFDHRYENPIYLQRTGCVGTEGPFF
jgi:outer membrane receptor protein involved in Fe transport